VRKLRLRGSRWGMGSIRANSMFASRRYRSDGSRRKSRDRPGDQNLGAEILRYIGRFLRACDALWWTLPGCVQNPCASFRPQTARILRVCAEISTNEDGIENSLVDPSSLAVSNIDFLAVGVPNIFAGPHVLRRFFAQSTTGLIRRKWRPFSWFETPTPSRPTTVHRCCYAPNSFTLRV